MSDTSKWDIGDDLLSPAIALLETNGLMGSKAVLYIPGIRLAEVWLQVNVSVDLADRFRESVEQLKTALDSRDENAAMEVRNYLWRLRLVNLPVVGKMLGHGAGSSATAVYARLDTHTVKAAVEKATAAIMAQVKAK